MPPLSTAQKAAAVAQFIQITGASDKVANTYLKKTAYKVNLAVDAYFSKTPGTGNTSAVKETALKNQFESLRKTPEDTTNKLQAEATMAYLQSLGVEMESASVFIAMELLQAETFGEITKTGFVEGWKAAGVDAKLSAQKNHIHSLTSSMSSSPDIFRKAYRYTFLVGKEPSQRALSLENAIVYWDLLFRSPGLPWKGKRTGIDFLQLWNDFLSEKWTRSVNRDMWNQTLEFAIKSIDDESLSFWNEDGAWPGVIDDFVAWYKAKRAGAMDVDST